VFGHITHGFTCTLVDNARPDRHFHADIFAALTGTVTALAVLATLCAESFFETVVDQGVKVFVGFKPYVTAVTAVAAIRAATRNVFFTAEAYATITAITCHDQDRCFINKLHFTLRKSFA